MRRKLTIIFVVIALAVVSYVLLAKLAFWLTVAVAISLIVSAFYVFIRSKNSA